MSRPNDDAPMVEVMQAVNAARRGEDVDLAALRCSIVAKHDQISALARTVSGLDPLIQMTVPLLVIVDCLDAGDLDSAEGMVSRLLR